MALKKLTAVLINEGLQGDGSDTGQSGLSLGQMPQSSVAIFILFLFLSASIVAGEIGADVNTPVSSTDFKCMKEKGVGFFTYVSNRTGFCCVLTKLVSLVSDAGSAQALLILIALPL